MKYLPCFNAVTVLRAVEMYVMIVPKPFYNPVVLHLNRAFKCAVQCEALQTHDVRELNKPLYCV